MQLSKKGVSRRTEQKIFQFLYQVLADLRKPDQIAAVFDAILRPVEKTMLAKRLAIAWYLKKNHSYRAIKNKLKVSSVSIAAVRNRLRQNDAGLALALKTIEADEWAGDWAEKISAKITSWRQSFTSPPPRPT